MPGSIRNYPRRSELKAALAAAVIESTHTQGKRLREVVLLSEVKAESLPLTWTQADGLASGRGFSTDADYVASGSQRSALHRSGTSELPVDPDLAPREHEDREARGPRLGRRSRRARQQALTGGVMGARLRLSFAQIRLIRSSFRLRFRSVGPDVQ
jgi:hypothetical protein